MGTLGCTSGPYGAVSSPTCLGPACTQTTIPNLASIINSAPNGAVVCIQRGENLAATAGITFTATHPDLNRVTLCVSFGTTCADTGGPNPRLTITNNGAGGRCMSWSGTGGYDIRFIDCYTTPAPSSSTPGNRAISFDNGAHDISFFGGTIDTFFVGFFTNTGTPPSNIHLGSCAARATVQGTPNPYP